MDNAPRRLKGVSAERKFQPMGRQETNAYISLERIAAGGEAYLRAMVTGGHAGSGLSSAPAEEEGRPLAPIRLIPGERVSLVELEHLPDFLVHRHLACAR